MKNLSFFVSISVLVFSQSGFSQNDRAGAPSGSNSQGQGGRGGGGCNGKTSSVSADQVKQIAQTVHKEKADCYMKLYEAETSNNASCYQTHTPNPPGIGLCTLEGNASLREPRGGDCAVPDDKLDGDQKDGVEQQMKCCAHIMKTATNYFQPVNEGKVPKCE